MKSSSYIYPIPESRWIEKLCRWADKKFDFFALTDGNDYNYPNEPFKFRFLAGNKSITPSELWDPNLKITKVGIVGYDFKNNIEKLSSKNPEYFELPELCFFKSEFSLEFHQNKIHSTCELISDFWAEVEECAIPNSVNTYCAITAQITKEKYLKRVETIQNHIVEGDTYESNFCQAYFGSFEVWDPIAAYFRLKELSPMPFSALFKAKSQWLVSASPERYIKRIGRQIIAQPIKGTIRRGSSVLEDDVNREKLANSEKEKAENLMITDLMRNDLSKVSTTGSVVVNELFGIYPLPRIFQMISTIESELKHGISFSDIIQATFPMGSMTGAPKISTMEIIDELESFKRGWFSGAFGIIEENGDFDFSVIIRSIIADLEVKKLYFGVGSAITYDADASQEYEECALKAQAILEVLSGK